MKYVGGGEAGFIGSRQTCQQLDSQEDTQTRESHDPPPLSTGWGKIEAAVEKLPGRIRKPGMNPLLESAAAIPLARSPWFSTGF